MRICFHGAAREVTGSCHLLDVNGQRVLLDCGMIQGGKKREARNRDPFGFPADGVDYVILSHAHIDHSGRLPLLVKRGYRGPILCTRSTAQLLEILLADSGRIHEEDARWKIKRLKRKSKDHSWVEPLFTEEDARKVLTHLVIVDFGEEKEIPNVGTAKFVKAGHILGAGILDLTVREGDTTRRIVFSGDLGVDGGRLLSAPKALPYPDYLLMESTYGDRNREESGDRTEILFDIVERTLRRGGKLVIPSFAVGRTQELLARLNDLVESGRLKNIRVFVDSPMAVHATHVFANNPQAYSKRAQDLLNAGDEPLKFPGLTLITDAKDSMRLNADRDPGVIISASGMCTAGRIKHHLKHNIEDPRATILFVGYQARESLGNVIQRGTTPVRIFGDWYDVRAEIATIQGFSAHADQAELVSWFESLGGNPKRTFLVHGEENSALALAGLLERKTGAKVTVPFHGEFIDLN